MSLSAACKVYVAFSDGPLVASPTWTEVTSYVRSVRVARGRSSEVDDFQAGTATVVLENTDRRFDPDYTSGAYYPNVKVRRQIKIEAVYSATTYPIFRGVVQAWNQEWPGKGKDATCVLQCADLFAILATWDLPDSAHELVIRTLSPSLWWRLDDTGGSAVDSMGSTKYLSYGANRALVDGVAPGTSGASRIEATSGLVELASGTVALAAGTAVSFAGTAYITATSGTVRLFRFSGSGDSLALLINNGVAQTNIIQNSPSIGATTGSTAVSGLHHFVVTRSGENVALYIDGAFDNSAATGVNNSFTLTSEEVAYPTTLVSYNDFTVSDFAVWESTVLTSTQAGRLGQAALGFGTEPASSRLSRLLDLLAVPSALYSIGASSASVGVFEGGTDALSYLLACARSDQGRLFVNRSGVITFQPKTTDMGGSSAATFSDNTGTANSVKYGGFGLELNDRLIYNKVTVTGALGVAFTAENTTSQTTYSVRSLTIDTALPTMDACRDVAQAYVARYADPSTRGKAWTVYPQRTLNDSTTLGYATVLGRELGDIVTVVRTPPSGSAISKTVQITSIEHTIDLPKGVWDVTFTGAPAYTTSSFRWGTSNWDGSDGWS